MNHLTEVTDSNLAEFLQQPITLIQFSADWCAPCRMLSPIVAELSNEYANVSFGKLNISDNPVATLKYEITSIPCLVFLKDGVEVNRVKGVLSKKALAEKIASSF